MASYSSLDLARQYATYAGVDIKCVIAGQVIGSMQAISYAVQREKAPIYVMGKVDPLSFSRGKRGIAGTMISLLLDRHMIYATPFGNSQFIADNDEIFPGNGDLNDASGFNASSPLGELGQVGEPTGGGAGVSFDSSNVSDNYQATTPWYIDQVLPFDVTIVAANEYGQASAMRIYGCEVLNEGSGFSIDDIVIENQMTYVCRTILPWKKLGHWGGAGPNGEGFNRFWGGDSAGAFQGQGFNKAG